MYRGTEKCPSAVFSPFALLSPSGMFSSVAAAWANSSRGGGVRARTDQESVTDILPSFNPILTQI